MNVSKQSISIDEARAISLVDYLAQLGYQPVKIKHCDYWYLSPLRIEKTASFKVNKNINRWYDHGLGVGGNLIDFAIQYHHCSVGQLLQHLRSSFFLQEPRLLQAIEQFKTEPESQIKVIREGSITSFALLRYLHQRRIPLDIAERFCVELNYEIRGKEYFSLGFKNDAGGYEIRNPYFKGSTSPKDVTTIKNQGEEVKVFKGFLDFLSFITIHQNQEQRSSDYMVLNSVSFFEKARSFLEAHEAIRLYLDSDTTGQNYSQYALSLSAKYNDESQLYAQHKDLNDWLVNFGKSQRKKMGRKL